MFRPFKNFTFFRIAAMRKRLFLAAPLFLQLTVLSAPLSAQSPGPGFVSLFNGRDFTNWDITPDRGAWVIEKGEILCKGKPGVPYLVRSVKEYENFEFYIDFRISKGCNSGIFYHVRQLGRESRIGFETQILDDAGTDPNKTSSGSIYDVIAPKTNAMKPAGEWNRYHILFDWPRCKVWLNDTIVQDIDCTADPVFKYRLRKGIIGLSNHGSQAWFRNIWVKELPGKERWENLFNGRDLSGWVKIGDADWQVRDGEIVAAKGGGYLVTAKEYEHFQFQAVAANDTLQERGGCFWYRFISPEDPEYSADFYDYPDAVRLTKQYGKNVPDSKVIPAWKNPWLLYQVMSSDRESEIRTGGYITAKNFLLGKARPGKIAIYHSPEDGLIRIRDVRIQQLESKGL